LISETLIRFAEQIPLAFIVVWVIEIRKIAVPVRYLYDHRERNGDEKAERTLDFRKRRKNFA